MPFKPLSTLIALAIGFGIAFGVPVPAGVSVNAWHLLAIFVATIAAIIGKAMPIGALAIISMAVVGITGVTNSNPSVAIKDVLSSFANPIIWLIGFAIMISHGLIKTGLGARIGYWFISLFGKKSMGVAYALAVSELIMAPITPSNTARGGAIMHPIMRSIADSFDSKPDESRNKIGRFLALVNFNTNPITSAMFVTATAPNPLVVKFVAQLTGAHIQLSWGTWALAMLLPGLVCLALMPWVVYWLNPPAIKETPDAPTFAREQLAKLGKISRQEWIMIGVFAILLLFWAQVPAHLFGPAWKLHSATTALMGLSLLLLTGVLKWEEILQQKAAWDTVVWFSSLIMMATYLNKLGLFHWFADAIQHAIGSMGLGTSAIMAILLLIYLYTHYFFASTTAHITAIFSVFYGAGLTLGAPPMLFALMMAAASSLMMSLTHYATGTAPVIFNSGYVTLGEWWKTGFVMSVVNIAVWVLVGLVWWKVLGYY